MEIVGFFSSLFSFDFMGPREQEGVRRNIRVALPSITALQALKLRLVLVSNG